jgi:uncharacterized protein (TIGR02996 family)
VVGLLSAIVAHPDDDLRRQVLADWLEDRGDPRAGVVRDAGIEPAVGPNHYGMKSTLRPKVDGSGWRSKHNAYADLADDLCKLLGFKRCYKCRGKGMAHYEVRLKVSMNRFPHTEYLTCKSCGGLLIRKVENVKVEQPVLFSP